ncbi:signal peptidase II [Aliidiomarina shirensis]|uniref:signal peptidase II n=1 Tax=Aliidiomarina shirensis TaxID=1048642 RepID=UPI0018E4DD10|nr:signal peptidase II [Aliidiomarina shirensis]
MPQQWQQSGWHWWWLVALLIVADQFSKWLILENMPLYSRINVLPFFDLVYVRNYGAAFSFLSDQSGWQRWFFTAIAVVISVVLIVMLRRQPKSMKAANLGFGLIVAGAIGNVIDRINYGYVVDFLDVYVGTYHWPAFNVADSCIVIGAGLIIFDGFFSNRPDK